MKYISLLELTPAELNGDHPASGREIVHRGVRYLILQVKTCSARQSKWKRIRLDTENVRYQLLVEALQPLPVETCPHDVQHQKAVKSHDNQH